MRTFPRLDHSPAIRDLVDGLMRGGVQNCRDRRASWHPSAWYGPTGGSQAGVEDLTDLADGLTRIATDHGYPDPSHRDTRGVDIAMAIHLYERMDITPVEATAAGVWNFLSCIVVPDIVAWRFPAKHEGQEPGNPDRWVVDRRWYRHALGRLWWRACMFRELAGDDPWRLMRQLQEDEFIQLMERPHLAGYSEPLLHLVEAMLAVFRRRPDLNRGTLMRLAAKRLLRLGAVIDLHALDAKQLDGLMAEIAAGTTNGMEGAHAASAGA